MESIDRVAELALVLSALALAALAIEPVASRLDLPAPLLFLGGGLVLGLLWPDAASQIRPEDLGGVGSVALVVILANGGLLLGLRRFRSEARPILALGVLGTAATFALVAVSARYVADLSWETALIVGAVLAPTDPAAVFSVLAGRGLSSRRIPAVLEGEAGVNDPVAIALAIALIDAATDGGEPSVLGILGTMASEGAIGAVVGIAAGVVVARLLDQEQGPTPPVLSALTVLAGAFLAFGAADLVHGSGFLAVYLYGLVIGDRAALRQRESVLGLHGQLASLAEIGMFVLLGVDLTAVDLSGAMVDGIVLGLLLLVVIRPLVAVPTLLACGLSRAEATFGAWAGLKGAVPILLGTLPLSAGLADGRLVFALTGIAVLVSLVVQGATLGRAAGWLGLRA